MSWFNKKIPEVAEAFSEMRNTVFKEGAIDLRIKNMRHVCGCTQMNKAKFRNAIK